MPPTRGGNPRSPSPLPDVPIFSYFQVSEQFPYLQMGGTHEQLEWGWGNVKLRLKKTSSWSIMGPPAACGTGTTSTSCRSPQASGSARWTPCLRSPKKPSRRCKRTAQLLLGTVRGAEFYHAIPKKKNLTPGDLVCFHFTFYGEWIKLGTHPLGRQGDLTCGFVSKWTRRNAWSPFGLPSILQNQKKGPMSLYGT